MKLFTMGPVSMFPHTLEISKQQIPYFRTKEFSDVMIESEKLLKEFTGAKEEDKVVFLTASGTAAMEATIVNCFSKKDKLLIIDGGTFGHRFTEICNAYKIPYEAIELSFEEVLKEQHLRKYEGAGFSGLLVNLHETSTGQLYDCKMLSMFCERNNCYFVVDAIGTFLAEPYKMEQMKIDITILSSQKGLALAPGMAFVVVNNRIYEERLQKKNYQGMYFDFNEHIMNQKRGQTPYTPAVGIVLELHDMLKHIEKETIEVRLKNMKEQVNYFRRMIKKLGIEIPKTPLSFAETPLLFENADVISDVYIPLKERFQIEVTPSGGTLNTKMLRVGHFGYHTKKDYDELLEKLQILLTNKT